MPNQKYKLEDAESDPYAEGSEAYYAGRSDTTNPYDPQSDAHLSWNDGYNEAAESAD